MGKLAPLIEQVKADNHSHVVLFLDDAGLHWRGESEKACQCMSDVIGMCKVMPREKFIHDLEALEAQAMTPHRALIEAAEEAKQILSDVGNSSFTDSIIEAMNILDAAIASAKAAEEGVETTWRVKDTGMDGFSHFTSFTNEPDSSKFFSECLRWYGVKSAELARIDTYTTVIKVRKKEGL